MLGPAGPGLNRDSTDGKRLARLAGLGPAENPGRIYL